MTITSGSLRGEEPPKKPKATPEQRKAIALLNSIDSGMTLTRFQIEAARKYDGVEDIPYDFDHFVKVAVFALSVLENEESDEEKAIGIGVALESLVIAVDLLDRDVEDVAVNALNDEL